MATIKWIGPNNSGTRPTDGDFAAAVDWSTGTVPGAKDLTVISGATDFTVTSSTNEKVLSLSVLQQATLAVTGGVFVVGYPANPKSPQLDVGADAAIDVSSGGVFELVSPRQGKISQVDGSINVASGGELLFSGAVSSSVLQGNGQINLAAGSKMVISKGFGGQVYFTGGTIQGAGDLVLGIYGLPSLTVGLLDANQSSGRLAVTFEKDQSTPSSISGNLEATAGGNLVLGSTSLPSLFVADGSTTDTIRAIGAGSIVDLVNVAIEGATLSTSGGGVIETTVGGASSLGGYDQLSGTIGAGNRGRIDVRANTTLAIIGTLTNTGTIAVASNDDTAELRLKSAQDYTNRKMAGTVTFAGTGTIALSDNANNLIDASNANITLSNAGNTISGAGRIGGSAAMNVMNAGLLDATGKNALTVDVATGRFTNQAQGTLRGSGAAGLQLVGGTFRNNGKVVALDGSIVRFGSAASLTNNVDGTLTGGQWQATSTGDGATIAVSGAGVTTDAASIVLSGAGSVFATGTIALEQSLLTIAAGGKLELLDGRGWTSQSALADDGYLQLGGGTFDAGGLNVGSKGSVKGFGTIDAPVTDDGLVEAAGGKLVLAGSTDGSGTLRIDGQATLEVAGALASTDSIDIHGVHATLLLDHPAAFASTITWQLGGVIDLAGTDATSAAITDNSLVVGLADGSELDYALAGTYSDRRVVLSSDKNGGTDLTLYKSQATAASAPSAPPHTATQDGFGHALFEAAFAGSQAAGSDHAIVAPASLAFDRPALAVDDASFHGPLPGGASAR